MLCLLPAVCSQGNLFTFLSLSVLVDKMGFTQIELLGGLHEVIPEKKMCVEQWRAIAGALSAWFSLVRRLWVGAGLTSDAYSHRF